MEGEIVERWRERDGGRDTIERKKERKRERERERDCRYVYIYVREREMETLVVLYWMRRRYEENDCLRHLAVCFIRAACSCLSSWKGTLHLNCKKQKCTILPLTNIAFPSAALRVTRGRKLLGFWWVNTQISTLSSINWSALRLSLALALTLRCFDTLRMFPYDIRDAIRCILPNCSIALQSVCLDGVALIWDFPVQDGEFDLRHLNSSSSPSGIKNERNVTNFMHTDLFYLLVNCEHSILPLASNSETAGERRSTDLWVVRIWSW